jgi:hypothetical protein
MFIGSIRRMKRIGFVGVVVAAGIVPCFEMTARPVHASCLTPCAVQLCAGTALGTADEMPSIVTATYDAAVPGVLTVETVLREGSSGAMLQPGDTLAATEPISGSHLLVYASTPPAWFPIDGDGVVRCAFVDSSQLPLPGHGATPQTIATLAGTSTCEDQLSRAGYPIPACNDLLSPSSPSGCQIGAGASPGHARLGGLVVVALGGALATLAATGSRRRRGQKRNSDGGGFR